MDSIKIIPYQSKYKSAFRDLNKEWIDRYFTMEEADYKSLDNPDEYILGKGGEILVVLLKGKVVGVCALIKSNNGRHDYELAKMAVSPDHQGLGIGKKLGKAIIDLARDKHAKSIFLESNTILTPAISLYRKLGFVEIDGFKSPYKRSNIQMEIVF